MPTGLANALDLTDRSLARLAACPSGSPQLLHFPPYTKEQLTAILTERLGQVGTWTGGHTEGGLGPVPMAAVLMVRGALAGGR